MITSISETPSSTSIANRFGSASCVHIVDDDPHFRTALRLLLQCAGFATEEYLSAEHFLLVYRPKEIECVLLDLRMPGLNGFELQQELKHRRLQVPVIVISGFAETPSVVEAIRNGASDFLEKPIEDHLLIEKVTNALESDRRNKTEGGDMNAKLNRLSEREREVMNLFLEAKSTLEIAHLLGISPKTVEKHRIHIFTKLSVASVPEMMCRLARTAR
jgi:two-component system response regulator FixJ